MNPQDKHPREEELNEREQQNTEGGGLLGGDDSTSRLTSVLGVNLESSHTDEDGETESSSLGGSLGSDTKSMTSED